MIFDILDKTDKEIDIVMIEILSELHKNGPVNQELLEKCALIKYFKQDVFSKYESKLMYLLGLFYKVSEPKDLLSFVYNMFNESIYEQTNNHYTPVQNSIYMDIKENKTYSFSAPTSAGKSYLLRKLISETENDVAIVVPSRALIAEYIFTLRNTFSEDKSILILSFVENINKKKTRKRIFVLTPERVPELYKSEYQFNISMFLFDEAQIADDKIRGINFANVVKKSEQKYPNAKKIFAHPFIENPKTQLDKLNLSGEAKSFQQSVVGKIFITKKKDKNYLFNPYMEKANYKKNQRKFNKDIVKELLSDGKTVLFYISKSKITSKTFLSNFKEYIGLCNVISDGKAKTIINRISDLINAKEERNSMIVYLLERGIVVHHGSIPLDIRFLLEQFTTLGYAKICFSTSTLLQGINMPFDAIVIDNFRFYGNEDDKNLALKNLIGRAGRTTNKKDAFDYGFVIVNNEKTFSERLCQKSRLAEESVLEQELKENTDVFDKENIEAVKTNSVDIETNEPISRIKRLKSEQCKNNIANILNILFQSNEMRPYGDFSENEKETIKCKFQDIFEIYINRQLQSGERYVFKSGLTILLWIMQGNSFKKILNLRYNYLAHGNEAHKIYLQHKTGKINDYEKNLKLESLKLEFSPIPYHLPNINLKNCPSSSFGYKTMLDFDYDSLVYDTYDYVDKIVELSLLSPFLTAFKIYADEEHDERATKMLDYLKYGTIDKKHIMLKKYGFSEEHIDEISNMVIFADENEIKFDMIKTGEIKDPILMDLISRYSD
ncbi:MAG: DEAD/DEAH box helicase [Treponema brennaborense]|nr:DEAD/DEAH box helicase [Muribaculaceae bacterium]MCM1408117.1 DEAD/DEAH box helicase [Treponema brennaborense]